MPSGHASWHHTISDENRSMATLKVHSDGSFAKVPASFCGGKDHMDSLPVSSIYQTSLDSPQSGIPTPSIHEMFSPLFRLYFLSLKGDTQTLQGVILFHVVFICANFHMDSLRIQVVKLQLLQFPRWLVLSVFLKMEPGFPRVQKKPGC